MTSAMASLEARAQKIHNPEFMDNHRNKRLTMYELETIGVVAA